MPMINIQPSAPSHGLPHPSMKFLGSIDYHFFQSWNDELAILR